MITWINFLHIYQPPTQTKEVIDKIVEQSYKLIPKLIQTYPNTKFTINFAGSLIELLEKYGHTDVIQLYKKLVDEGRIELTGSAMYHPLLAYLPSKEIERQIEHNNQILKKYFGATLDIKGFFIPEMAYAKNVADVVQKMGFKWIIIDDISFPQGKPDSHIHYSIKNNGLSVVFRNRLFSKTFPPHYVFEHTDEIKNENIIIAHDGELYGHWHTDDKGYYQKSFTSPDITFKTVSEYLSSLKEEQQIIIPQEASWESLKKELDNNIPFALWNDPKNKIHKELWNYAEVVMKIVEKNTTDKNYSWARKHMDRGLASCAWWWATGKMLSQSTTLCWNPTEIEKGAQELLTAVRSLQEIKARDKVKAEEKFSSLRTLIWKTHWEKYTT